MFSHATFGFLCVWQLCKIGQTILTFPSLCKHRWVDEWFHLSILMKTCHCFHSFHLTVSYYYIKLGTLLGVPSTPHFAVMLLPAYCASAHLLEYPGCALVLWSIMLISMRLHILIARWQQRSWFPGLLLHSFPLNFEESQIVTLHHFCSEVLLLFRQICTVLSGVNPWQWVF